MAAMPPMESPADLMALEQMAVEPPTSGLVCGVCGTSVDPVTGMPLAPPPPDAPERVASFVMEAGGPPPLM